MTRKSLAAFALALFLPSVAAAQNWYDGIYVEGRGGASFLTDSDTEFFGADAEAGFDTGWLIDGAVGYAHDSGLRGEIALGYRENDTDELDVELVGKLDLDGEVTAFSAMFNGYYDFHLDKFGAEGAITKLTPFIGAGIGAAVIGADAKIAGARIVDDSDTVFAFQAIAGLSYGFTPNLAATLTYAYFTTSDPKFEDELGGEFEAEYASHNVMAGLRYSF